MKLLYLTHRVPDPPNRGDRIRAHHLLRFLAAEHQVYLGCLADEPVSAESLATLEELCAQVAIAPIGPRRRWINASLSVGRGRTATEGLFNSAELHRVIRNWARHTRFDAIVVFCSSMLQYAEAPELADTPVIVDLVDVDSQKWFDYAERAAGLKRRLFQLEGSRLRKLESSLPARVQGVTLVSEAEAELFRKICPNDRTYGIPNGVDLDYFTPNSESLTPTHNRCVFLGALDYKANIDGLRWFCAEVWPEVHRRLPSLRFQMVGRRPAVAIHELAQLPGVELIGEVPDVRPYLSNADFVVAPLLVARGLQNKVLEALACGKPVLATPQALEGLSLEVDRDALSAKSREEWVQRFTELHANAELRRSLGRHGRIFVEDRHCWSACLAPFLQLLEREHLPHPLVDAGHASPSGLSRAGKTS